MIKELIDLLDPSVAVGLWVVGCVGLTVPREIEGNHLMMIIGELRHCPRLDPVRLSIREPRVNQHYGFPASLYPIVNPDPINREKSRLRRCSGRPVGGAGACAAERYRPTAIDHEQHQGGGEQPVESTHSQVLPAHAAAQFRFDQRDAQAVTRRCAPIGKVRSRVPVAAKIALQIAGATNATAGSPMPPGVSSLSSRCTSSSGSSLLRSTR